MPILTIAFIVDFIILAIFGFYVFKTYKRKTPVDQIEKTQEKSYQLLHSAINKASQIVEETNRQQVDILADSVTDARKFEEEVKQTYSANTSSAKQMFESQLKEFLEKITSAENEYINYLDELKQKTTQAQENSLQTIKQNTGELFLKFEQNLSDFLTQTQAQSTSSIELELQATRQMIETYRQQQFKLIDENIIAMLERTLSLVLPRKLSLNDQVELIYESLEKAKAEKFIG